MSFARGTVNELKKSPNRIVILSWNLQNFTGDQRCGRSNGKIDSPRNQVRAAFVAAVMRAARVNALLAMETGSDVSQAMESIRRQAGLSLRTLETERTHDTPKVDQRFRLQFRFGSKDVWAFRNLVTHFRIEPGRRRRVDIATAVNLMCDVHGLDHFDPLPADPRAMFERIARTEATSEVLRGARGLVVGTLATLRELVAFVTYVRIVRLLALDAGETKVARATEQLELLQLCAYFWNGAAIEPDDARQLLDCGPTVARFVRQKTLPCCLFLLMASEGIELVPLPGDELHELDSSRMVYDALRHFQCVEFHFETYGVLLDESVVCMKQFLSTSAIHFEVLRQGQDGELLGTQRPGSSYNWRSALRMLLPLKGGKWIDTLLFHTRFTASELARADREHATQAERAYAMRAAGIEEIAKLVAVGKPLGVPIAFFGDFNLPMGTESAVIAAFARDMSGMGFQRLPADIPATTLRAISTLTASDGDSYSAAYDGLYAHGLSGDTCTCVALTLDRLMEMVGPEIHALMQPAVAAHYARQVDALCDRLNYQWLSLNGDAKLGILSAVRDLATNWDPVVMQCEVLRDWPAVRERLRAKAVDYGREVTMSKNADVLGLGLQSLGAAITAARSTSAYLAWSNVHGAHRLRTILDVFEAELNEGFTVLGGLETSPTTRFAVAYASIVSDHLPLLATIDLDGGLAPVTSSEMDLGDGSTSSAASGSAMPSSTAALLPVPGNAAEFLVQQGGDAEVLARYGAFLARLGLDEGTASSDVNVCLLDTLAQLVYGVRGTHPDAIAALERETGVRRGVMLAIGAPPFPDFLRTRGITLLLWTLNLDGNLAERPIRIGHDSGRVVNVLYYGAHYVPLFAS